METIVHYVLVAWFSVIGLAMIFWLIETIGALFIPYSRRGQQRWW